MKTVYTTTYNPIALAHLIATRYQHTAGREIQEATMGFPRVVTVDRSSMMLRLSAI